MTVFLGIEAGAVFEGIELMVPHNHRPGISLVQLDEEVEERVFLSLGTGVGWPAVLV